MRARGASDQTHPTRTRHPQAVCLAALVVITGCGRIGFGTTGDHGDDGDSGGGDAAPACVASSFPVATTAARSEFPALAWNGTKLGIAWTEDPIGTPSGQFRTVSLGGSADPIFTVGRPSPTEDFDVTWDGASWRLAWSEDTTPDREIFRSTNGAPAEVITSNGRTDLEVRQAPLAGGTTGYLWTANVGGAGYDLVLAVLDAAGTKLVADLTIAQGLNGIAVHDLVWTGSELVAFYATTTQLVMLRMTSSGSTIAGPIPVATEPVSSDVSASWLGDRFLVTWFATGNGIYIAYVSPSGELLSPILRSPKAPVLTLRVSSAAGATSDVVAWDDIGTRSAYLLPVTREGALGTIVEFSLTASIAAAWVGTTWAIAARQGETEDIYLLQLCP